MASEKCIRVLALLARSHNVMVSGPPGTGKSKLLAEVALAFEDAFGLVSSAGKPHMNPKNGIPIPPSEGADYDIPAPGKKDRKVFRTVFHQNSKYRDFVSGIMPTVNKTYGSSDFTIIKGTLYRASEYAKLDNGSALLLIDEINRGPAVQVFGGTIVSIESDKRLAPNGGRLDGTQFFEMLDPDSGEVIEYALPHDLYILAAMNQADASIDPMDVAFLRRWEPLRLEPEEQVLRGYYGLGPKSSDALPDVPTSAFNALEASVRAWVAVNEQIALGRGQEFQIGHGVLMSDAKPHSLALPDTLEALCVGWAKVRAHVEEVFFGDIRGVAATLNALGSSSSNPFKLTETTFADVLRFRLEGPTNFTASNIYSALKAFSGE